MCICYVDIWPLQIQTEHVELIQPFCKHVWEFLCVSLSAKVLPLVSCFWWFFTFHKLLHWKSGFWMMVDWMMVDCFSPFGFPNPWYLSISLSTLFSLNPRFLTRTFRTFFLICSSVPPSARLIPSMTMHACRWYCWRSSTSFSSSEFVFFATIRELSSNSTFCSSCLILASSRDILFSLSNSVEPCLFGVFDADDVTVWS